MKRKLILTTIFTTGIALGAVASEIAENGLYIFNSGDPIVATEVNANFDNLLQKITSLEGSIPVYEEKITSLEISLSINAEKITSLETSLSTYAEKITALEASLSTYVAENSVDPIVGTWSCINTYNRSGYLVFDENGRFSETGVDVFNGIGSGWQFAAGTTYILTGNGTESVTVTFTNDNNNMHLLPPKFPGDAVNCTKS